MWQCWELFYRLAVTGAGSLSVYVGSPSPSSFKDRHSVGSLGVLVMAAHSCVPRTWMIKVIYYHPFKTKTLLSSLEARFQI